MDGCANKEVAQLIMMLNPPFGVRGVKGDQFIDKTPEFRSKFVIHIVPTRAERLDERKTALRTEMGKITRF